MADRLEPSKARAAKSRSTPVLLRHAQTAPIDEEDYQQAVTALAIMIADWWHDQQPRPD